MANRHHLLVIKRGLECLTCHQLIWNPALLQYEAVVTRNCPQCHTGSLANRHHLLVNQVTYTCFTCHTVIWDPAQMMYVPVFNNSCNVPPPAFTPRATIGGTVTNTSGAGLPWVQVATDTGLYSALTTATGAYQLADVAPGSYVITASASGYVSASQSVSVVDGQTAVVGFVLSSAPVLATLSGQVVDTSSAPVPGAIVSTGSGLYTALTDVDGNFTLMDVPAGSYVLTAQKAGYGFNSQSVSVTGGQIVALQFVLPAIPAEICGDGIDNDGNGYADCADQVCANTAQCLPPVEVCGDGVDNDANGFTDCADPVCIGMAACVPPPVELCTDGVDNDGNGLVDCVDPACLGRPECHIAGMEVCNDGLDNDANGLTDCGDPACMGTDACPTPVAEICGDGIDNNNDGLLDCADPICGASPPCLYEVCKDGIDNDGNGLVDCADPACAQTSSCLPPPVEICGDGIDNDGNGLTDCADPKCAPMSVCNQPAVNEICDNGIDDNADGFVDCADPQCVTRAICLMEICHNGVDDDGDGFIDCGDPDCMNVAGCGAPPVPGSLPFTARASHSEDGHGAEKVGDGDLATYWRTARNHDQWVRLDLGGIYRVNEVDLHWSTEFAKNYKVKVSRDGRYWRTVKEVDNGDGGLDALVFSAREARYVIVDLEDAATSGYSIAEIVVFQEAASPGSPDAGTVGGSDGGTPSGPPNRNLALNSPVVASSFVGGYGPSMAVDANMGTRWKAQGHADEWIRVDLGSVVTVSKVVIHWHREYAEDFRVRVSPDGNQWKAVMEVKHGHGGRGAISFAPREARYVQIDCEYPSHRSPPSTEAFSIYELEVYRH